MLPKISEAEFEIITVLWEESPLTSNEIVARLAGRSTWNDKTIRTLINRLVQKKAVGYEKEGKQYHYRPLVDADSYRAAETESFLKKLYSGSLNVLMASFIKESKLSPDEMEALRKLLDEDQ